MNAEKVASSAIASKEALPDGTIRLVSKTKIIITSGCSSSVDCLFNE